MGNTKYNKIRSLARRKIELLLPYKECLLCDFVYPEVCHIQSISSFDKETKLSVVNSLDNLVYLCPNHHYLLDVVQDKDIIKEINDKLAPSRGIEPL